MNKKIPIIRLIILLALIGTAAVYSCRRLHEVRNNYQDEEVLIQISSEDNTRKHEAAKEVLIQGDLFGNWAILILGGVVALITTAKVHKTPFYSWIYITLGPAVTFLIGSLFSWWDLRKRFTYLTVKQNFSDFDSLSKLLLVQFDLFIWAVILVGIFTLWFLSLLVLGKISPFGTEDNRK